MLQKTQIMLLFNFCEIKIPVCVIQERARHFLLTQNFVALAL